MFSCDECGCTNFNVVNIDKRNDIMYLECAKCGEAVEIEDFSSPFFEIEEIQDIVESYEHDLAMVG
jgi:transcription elongation factor Elf1